MKYTTYDPETGAVLAVYSLATPEQVQANLAGQSWIQGEYPSDRYYVSDGVAVAIPESPIGAHYQFDLVSKTWRQDQTQLIEAIRSERNYLLSDIDRVNPLWYSSLTAQQQQELATYRQSLLDVPQQAGFPVEIIWPAKPTWL